MGGGTAFAYEDKTVEYYDLGIKAPSLGNYAFSLKAFEVPSHEWLPIVSKDYFPTTVASYITEVDNTSPSAKYKSKPITKVDVVFALGELSQLKQLENYMPNFEAKLSTSSNDLDTQITSVETVKNELSGNGYDVDDIINSWDVIGSDIWRSSGGTIYCEPNNSWHGTAMLSPDAYESEETLYRITVGDTGQLCDGICFNVTRTGNKLNGYFINFGGHGSARCHLYKFDNYNIDTPFDTGINYYMWCGWKNHPTGQVFSAGSSGAFIKLAEWDVRANVTYEASYKNNNITIKRDGINIVDLYDSSYPAGTFGLWGNNCEASTSMVLSDIYVSYGKTVKKTLGESLSEVMWRDDAVRFVIHGTDVIPEECLPGREGDFQYTITKLLNSNAYLINLGTSVNKVDLDRLLRAIKSPIDNTDRGIYYSNYPISTALNNSAQYIIEKTKNLSKPSDYILVNTEIKWETEYDDYERDLPLNYGGNKDDKVIAQAWGVGLTNLYRHDKILAERWRYRHTNTYYNNSPIVASFDNAWLQDPVNIFTNPGLYRVNYKRRDNPFYSDVAITNPFDSYRYWSTDYDPITEGK